MWVSDRSHQKQRSWRNKTNNNLIIENKKANYLKFQIRTLFPQFFPNFKVDLSPFSNTRFTNVIFVYFYVLEWWWRSDDLRKLSTFASLSTILRNQQALVRSPIWGACGIKGVTLLKFRSRNRILRKYFINFLEIYLNECYSLSFFYINCVILLPQVLDRYNSF